MTLRRKLEGSDLREAPSFKEQVVVFVPVKADKTKVTSIFISDPDDDLDDEVLKEWASEFPMRQHKALEKYLAKVLKN